MRFKFVYVFDYNSARYHWTIVLFYIRFRKSEFNKEHINITMKDVFFSTTVCEQLFTINITKNYKKVFFVIFWIYSIYKVVIFLFSL